MLSYYIMATVVALYKLKISTLVHSATRFYRRFGFLFYLFLINRLIIYQNVRCRRNVREERVWLKKS